MPIETQINFLQSHGAELRRIQQDLLKNKHNSSTECKLKHWRGTDGIEYKVEGARIYWLNEIGIKCGCWSDGVTEFWYENGEQHNLDTTSGYEYWTTVACHPQRKEKFYSLEFKTTNEVSNSETEKTEMIKDSNKKCYFKSDGMETWIRVNPNGIHHWYDENGNERWSSPAFRTIFKNASDLLTKYRK